jgi:sphingomyelin phosphodiesterase acid-like 3
MITLKKYFHLIFSICLLLFMNHPSFGSNHASFLSLSDIHFDPFTICDKKATSCPLIEKLANASSQEWKNILIQFDQEPAKYQQDTNYPLLAATLQTVGTVSTTKKTRFVLILGDYLAHHYKEKYQQFAVDKSNAGYQAFVKKTMEFITQELNTTFPTQDVYMLPGNNDSYLDDNVYEPHGIFFQEMAMLWSTAIKNSAAKSEMLTLFSQNGYYAVTPRKQPNMRIIALNSNLFSPVAKGNNIEAAANAQLDWLEQQLESALNQHQKVIIAMHIPA